MRVSGDIGCRPLRVWVSGLMDLAPEVIDHATLGAAPWGRNGWGAALLMRDVSEQLVAIGDEPVPEAHHLRFLDHCAALAARTWGWHDDLGLLPHRLRWQWFGPDQLEGERALGFPEPVPRLAVEGWERFAERAPAHLQGAIDELRRDPTPLSEAVLTTPQTFLHGDWKLGNLGAGRGRPHDPARLGLSRRRTDLPRARLVPRPQPSPPADRPHQGVDDRRLRGGVATATASPRTGGSNVSSASACSVPSCSSAGRRRSATTPSSAGGARPRPAGSTSCDPDADGKRSLIAAAIADTCSAAGGWRLAAGGWRSTPPSLRRRPGPARAADA